MRRRDFITGLGSTVACARSVRAQSRSYRVGVLDTVARANNPNFPILRSALLERGYVEGKNLSFEYRSPDGRNEGFAELASELSRLNVDVIVTRGTPAALAAKRASATIPVIMAAAGDPLGIIRQAPASGNLTGFGANIAGAERKRVEILSEMLPKLARVAALMNLSNPSRGSEWSEIEAAALALGIVPQVLDARTAADIAPAFASAARLHAGAMLIGSDTLVQTNRGMIVELAAMHGMPAIYPFRDFVEAGGLVSYGVSLPDLYRRAADYADRILKGAKPSELLVEPPNRAELVLSAGAAGALRLAIPETLLARAEIIQ